MFEYVALIALVLVLPFALKSNIYGFFFVVLLTTEFFYIEIGGGIARIYHFLAVLMVLVMIKYVPSLFTSRVFIAIVFFIAVNLGAIILSDTPERALASFLSVSANISIAMATALILLTGKVDLTLFKRIILTVTLVSILWGVLQIAAFRIVGVVLNLSLQQESQILMGFGPGFKTEANTFGKYLVFPFMLFLPEYIEYKSIKHVNVVYLIFLVGILMNFTRSAIYGMGIAILFIVFWYARNSKLFLLTQRSIKITAVVVVGVVLILSGVLGVSEYAEYKMNVLFNQREMLEGASASYRLQAMRLVIDDALTDTKKIIIGNGWGQTRYYFRRVEVQAGGGDLVNILGYCGLIGIIAYLSYMLLAFKSAQKAARTEQDEEKRRFAEGVVFSLVGIFMTSQMAGYLIAPEYWLLVGVCMFLEMRKRYVVAGSRSANG